MVVSSARYFMTAQSRRKQMARVLAHTLDPLLIHRTQSVGLVDQATVRRPVTVLCTSSNVLHMVVVSMNPAVLDLLLAISAF